MLEKLEALPFHLKMFKINIEISLHDILSIRLKINKIKIMDKRLNIFMPVTDKITSGIYLALFKFG